MSLSAFMITLLSGLSFIIGYVITLFIKNKNNLITFSLGFSFVIIIGLICFDLLPECLELANNKLTIVIFALFGIALLKSLDIFIPHHHHEGKSEVSHMEHIGLVSSIALFVHNIIEGTAIYTTSLTSVMTGAILAVGVSFHNIPLGIQISSLIKNKRNKLFLILALSISSLVGALTINVLNINITDYAMCILISITLGMLIYISLFEMMCEIKENIKKKELIVGLLSGIVVLVIGSLI